jgi:hypothetical protein
MLLGGINTNSMSCKSVCVCDLVFLLVGPHLLNRYNQPPREKDLFSVTYVVVSSIVDWLAFGILIYQLFYEFEFVYIAIWDE